MEIIIILLLLGFAGFALKKGLSQMFGDKYKFVAVHVSGVNGLKQNQKVILSMDKETVKINDYVIPKFHINSIESYDEHTIKTVERSVIKNAIGGGILFGGLGAVVGAVRGLKDKKEKVKTNFLVIDTKDESILLSAFGDSMIANMLIFKNKLQKSIRKVS